MTDTKKLISTLEMPEKVSLFKELYNELAGYGVEGDTELAHVNTFEARWLKSMGGSGSINDITGLREYKGGGGSPPPAPQPPSSVTQTSEFPTELRPFVKDILGEAKTEFQREKGEGYIPFGGPQLAQFTPEQQQAFETGRQQFGAQGLAGTPLGQASTYYQPALAATALGTSEIGTGDIQRRMDPFLQNVVDIAKREAVRDEDLAAQGRAAQAVGAGSFGGSRQAILEAEAERNLGQRLGDIQAQGLSQAFQNAQRAAEAQRARELSGGRQFAGLGESAFQRARGDITGLAGIGEAQQGRTQQALDLARREFEEEKAFPSTALQRYSSLIRGWGLTPTQTVVSTPAPVPRPGLAQQLAGAAGTGIGLYGQFGGFGRATGGLVGLMGGGTPMNPLRPPYELFPDRLNRQYNTGGIVGLNQGGKAGGSLFHKLIGEKLLQQLKDKGFGNQGQPPELGQGKEPFNVNLGRFVNTGASYHPGAATGGLLGLTVSKHNTEGLIQRIRRGMGTDAPGHSIVDDIEEQKARNRMYLETGINPLDITTGDKEYRGRQGLISYEDMSPEQQEQYLLAREFPGHEQSGIGALIKKGIRLLPSDEEIGVLPESEMMVSGSDLPGGAIAGEQKVVEGVNPYTGEEIFSLSDPAMTDSSKITDEYLRNLQGIGVEDPFPGKTKESIIFAADQLNQIKDQEAAEAAAGEDGLTSGSDDPLGDLRSQWEAGLLPDVPNIEAVPESLRAAQDEYLAALEGASEGYDQDKWGALTQLGLNLMSEQPQYQGESLLSIAGRAGKEPLAALQQAQKAEKGAKLNYLKSKVDIEGVRTSLKTQAEKDTFDNAIRKLLAGAELTKAEAALVAARVPDLKQPRKMGPSDFKLAGGVIKTSMRSALANSPSFVEYLTDLAGASADSSGEQKGLIDRLSNDEMVQAQVANGLEQFKTMELGKGRFPTNEELEIKSLEIIKRILDAAPDTQKGSGWTRLWEG